MEWGATGAGVRVTLATNAAGDIRLRLLSDKPDIQYIVPPQGGTLVCSDLLQEMTTRPKPGPRPGFGLISKRTTFGRCARQSIREAGAVLDSAPPRQCVFLTGTLPGSTDASLRALAAWSGWVVQTVLQWARDYAAGARLFGVWEYQKRGALHLHLVVQGRSETAVRQLLARWRQRWLLILDSLSARSGVDMYEREKGGSWRTDKSKVRVDAQRVEKSVSRYLSKYLSKPGKAKKNSRRYPPSSWTVCTRSLRQAVKHAHLKCTVQRLSLADAHSLFETIGGFLAEQSKKTFVVESAWDKRFKGLTVLTEPVRAWFLFQEIAASVRALGGEVEGVETVRRGGAWLAAEVLGVTRFLQSGDSAPRASPALAV